MIRVVAVVAGLASVVGVLGHSQALVTHEYADVNGVRLHYARAGRGPLMMFLHGFPEFWYEWKHQIADFGRDHTAVAPDMRGYNLSSKPTELSAYEMPQLVEDVRALAAHLLQNSCREQNGGTGLRTPRGDPSPLYDETCSRFTLVAHDWGGVVAWVFAAQHPEMLDKLVIVNAPHPTIFARELRENPKQQQASAYMLLFRSPEAEATLSANEYARLKQAVLTNAGADDIAAYVAAWSQPGALTGGLNYYRAARVGPPAPSAATASADAGRGRSLDRPPTEPSEDRSLPDVVVRVPTLVIWGEKDTALLTGNLDGLERVVPSLTIKRIPEGTHWVVRERAGDVNALIREFLAPK